MTEKMGIGNRQWAIGNESNGLTVEISGIHVIDCERIASYE
ncbi:MAG: hypothetical protein P8013_05860 [Candidatus Sulfobium sp.]